MEVNPYSPPEATIRDPASSPDTALRIAAPYRGLVRWFGLQLLFSLGGALVMGSVGPELGPAVALIRSLGMIVATLWLAIYAYRTALALGSKVGVLWALAMIVPLVNLLTLLLLSAKATRVCRAAGIPVGFLGPKQPSPPGWTS